MTTTTLVLGISDSVGVLLELGVSFDRPVVKTLAASFVKTDHFICLHFTF